MESIELKRTIKTNAITGDSTVLRVTGKDDVLTMIGLDTISFTIEGLQRVQSAIAAMIADANSLGYTAVTEPIE